MKAQITVIRTVEYSAVVDLPIGKIDELSAQLEGRRTDRMRAEKEIDALIKPGEHWQGDSVNSAEIEKL